MSTQLWLNESHLKLRADVITALHWCRRAHSTIVERNCVAMACRKCLSSCGRKRPLAMNSLPILSFSSRDIIALMVLPPSDEELEWDR